MEQQRANGKRNQKRIFGLVIAVLLNAGVKFFGAASAISPAGFSLLPLIIVVVAGLWSFVAVLLMLSRVERFGFWRTTAAYAVVLVFPHAARNSRVRSDETTNGARGM